MTATGCGGAVCRQIGGAVPRSSGRQTGRTGLGWQAAVCHSEHRVPAESARGSRRPVSSLPLRRRPGIGDKPTSCPDRGTLPAPADLERSRRHVQQAHRYSHRCTASWTTLTLQQPIGQDIWAQLLPTRRRWFNRISALLILYRPKSASQPEVVKNSPKTCFKVVQGHQCRYLQKACQHCLQQLLPGPCRRNPSSNYLVTL